ATTSSWHGYVWLCTLGGMLGTEKGRDGTVMVRASAMQPTRDSVSTHDKAVIRCRRAMTRICTTGGLAESTLLGGLRSRATWGNAGSHSGDCKIHGKDGVAGSIRRGPHTKPAAQAGPAAGLWHAQGRYPPFARDLPVRFVCCES